MFLCFYVWFCMLCMYVCYVMVCMVLCFMFLVCFMHLFKHPFTQRMLKKMHILQVQNNLWEVIVCLACSEEKLIIHKYAHV